MSIVFLTVTDTTFVNPPTGTTTVSRGSSSTAALTKPTSQPSQSTTLSSAHSGTTFSTIFTSITPIVTSTPAVSLPTTTPTSPMNAPLRSQQTSDAILLLIFSTFALFGIFSVGSLIVLIWKFYKGYCPGCKVRDQRIKFLQNGDPIVAKPTGGDFPFVRQDGDIVVDLESLLKSDHEGEKTILRTSTVHANPTMNLSDDPEVDKNRKTALDHLEGRSGVYAGDSGFDSQSRSGTSWWAPKGKAKKPDLESGSADLGTHPLGALKDPGEPFVDVNLHESGTSTRPDLRNPYAATGGYGNAYAVEKGNDSLPDLSAVNPYMYNPQVLSPHMRCYSPQQEATPPLPLVTRKPTAADLARERYEASRYAPNPKEEKTEGKFWWNSRRS
ncbi:hypothetical protein P280DRAFT_523079 [Massarina eburnea CBS 473.64]|uniref:Uncharacterized protein n=1 Tax=Massarina eburnea CBS 473.64 TaxID=1395130 RepID=A0A6A6RK57_9PLEO|nr:hypothetical protein P280DRAFT_523079 [Massarina eburnea CBS 473.64]